MKSLVLSQVKVINSDSINSMTILKDGRLATCLSNRSINIYAPNKNFNKVCKWFGVVFMSIIKSIFSFVLIG